MTIQFFNRASLNLQHSTLNYLRLLFSVRSRSNFVRRTAGRRRRNRSGFRRKRNEPKIEFAVGIGGEKAKDRSKGTFSALSLSGRTCISTPTTLPVDHRGGIPSDRFARAMGTRTMGTKIDVVIRHQDTMARTASS